MIGKEPFRVSELLIVAGVLLAVSLVFFIFDFELIAGVTGAVGLAMAILDGVVFLFRR